MWCVALCVVCKANGSAGRLAEGGRLDVQTSAFWEKGAKVTNNSLLEAKVPNNNLLEEAGTYWTTTTFIWSYLLLPFLLFRRSCSPTSGESVRHFLRLVDLAEERALAERALREEL